MKTVIHKSETRGHADHGWLKTDLTFSFAGYYDTSRIHFGALRVLNDDKVAPQMGFGTHPHDNMEIVTIVLDGEIRHKDSMGNALVIKKNEIQIMSAGSGITHSEFNAHNRDTLSLLQIWVFPKEKNIKPRYDQVTLNENDRLNTLQTIITPDKSQPMWINQDAWFSRSKLEKGTSISYNIHKPGNGVYVFVIDGDVKAGGQALKRRDGLGIWETDEFTVSADNNAEVLFIEIPMQF